MSDKCAKRLQELKKIEGNNKCAECMAPDPQYASYSIGVFLCEACCGCHRTLGVHISKTRSLFIDSWNSDQLKILEAKGNKAVDVEYLKCLPPFYPRPQPNSANIIREQWVRAKYEREEFKDESRQEAYRADEKSGCLHKKGRDDAKFLPRKFELHRRDNALIYYSNKDGAKDPKLTIPLDELNCTFVPDKIGHPNGMQMSFEVDGSTRNIFVYSEDGREIMDWYLAIRCSKLIRLGLGLPHIPLSELVKRLTRDFTFEGWLYKTGPNPRDPWRRRWFTLDGRRLLYSDEPLSAFCNGSVIIWHNSEDVAIVDGTLTTKHKRNHSFTLRTNARSYHLAADSAEEKEEWVTLLQKVIDTPIDSKDQALINLLNRADAKPKKGLFK